MLSVTLIADSAYCTRYAYLLHVKKIPPHRQAYLGALRHKCYEQLGNLEKSPQLKNLPKKEIEAQIKGAMETTVRAQESTLLSAGYTLEEAKKEVERAFKQKIKQAAQKISSNIPLPKTISEKSLKSEKLGVRGRVDKIVFAESTYPVEFKGWSERLERDSIQLAGYALLIEENYRTQVNKGIIEYLCRDVEVQIAHEMRSKFLECKRTAEAIKLGFVPSCNCSGCTKDCSYRGIGMA